jgi:Holliday junction DNA helicase RuvA
VLDTIHGRIAAREPGRVVIEAAGLGYLVQVPLSTFDVLPPLEREVRLLLHLVVREDEWRLFGFAAAREREVFRDLLRVSGVGPALSLALLSGLGPDALVKAVTEGDVRTLTQVRGVGKKTAERLAVELRERWREAGAGPGSAGRPALTGVPADAVRALEALGLERAVAARRVQAALAAGPAPAVGDLVRRALRA